MMHLFNQTTLKRFAACIAGSLVLALMVGSQEGSSTDYYYGFRKAVLSPRIAIFLLIGVVLFLAITFWPRLVPYLGRPGLWPLLSGALAVVAAQWLMHWYDPIGDKKFGTVAHAVANTAGISPLATAFFGWLAWTQLVVLTGLGIASVIGRWHWLAWAVAALSVAAGVVTYVSHQAVVDAGNGVDHSLGYAGAMLGYAVMAVAMVSAAVTQSEMARGREAVSRMLGFRPGLPLVVLGVLVCLLAFTNATWFSPQNRNDTLSDTHALFGNAGLAPIALAYLGWLGWVLLAASATVAGAATWLRHRLLGWIGAGLGVAGAVLTLLTLYDVSKLAAQSNVDSATGPWQNLGAGGWMACGGLFLIGAGALVAATVGPGSSKAAAPVPTGSDSNAATSFLSAPGAARSAVLIAVAVALFYPPTATPFWQQVLVSQIGISMLLAVGLNVVVGWAGLLDLGFIAFYAIGSYVTAYLVGSLPVSPPSWLHMTPLLAIPFAIVACLVAGLLLGAPTLRLRGDYLAIVTLGFGEIIHLAAVNAHSVTNGSEGPPKPVPHPSIHIGPLHIQWGLAQLQY